MQCWPCSNTLLVSPHLNTWQFCACDFVCNSAGWVSAKGRVPHVVLALLDTLRAHPGEARVVNDGKYVHEFEKSRACD